MRHVQTLFDRLSGFATSRKTVDLGAAFTAFVRDVVNKYIFGKHYNDLGKEDFDAGMVVAAQAGGLLWRTTKFIRFFGPFMRSIPPQWIMAVSDPIMKDFFRFMIVSPNLQNACLLQQLTCILCVDFHERYQEFHEGGGIPR